MNTPEMDLYDLGVKLDRIIALLEALQAPRRNSRLPDRYVTFAPEPTTLPPFTVTTTGGSDGTMWAKPTNCT